jgi:hypothetical protein
VWHKMENVMDGKKMAVISFRVVITQSRSELVEVCEMCMCSLHG